MAIGEFGGAPAATGNNGPMYAAPAYWFYEMSQAALNPSRAFADAVRLFYRNPANPLSYTAFGKTMAASLELFERSTRRYGKPEWNISSTVVGGERVPVHISTIWERPFCRLLHFERAFEHAPRRPQPRLLIVAPMSGHYPTLLRGTVEGFLPNHDVFLTEWVDARMVPVSEGGFDLDDYIDYLISMLHLLGGDVHMLAVCQPSVPVLAAVARMEAAGEAITFVTPEDEGDVRAIERALGKPIPRVTLPDFDYRAPPPPKTRGHEGPRSRGPPRGERRNERRRYRPFNR